MKQRKFALLCLFALLALSLVLCGCGQTGSVQEETVQTEPITVQTEAVPVEETVEVITENETFDDGTVAETVTTVEKLLSSDRTTVRITTNCVDGTVLVETAVTETFHDGGSYQESRKEIRYPEGGSYVALEIQSTNADMTFRQVEEYITQDIDGASYSRRVEIEVDEEGNTTVREISTQTDKDGKESREETVTVTDAEGNVIP